jgi:hypothetical protein
MIGFLNFAAGWTVLGRIAALVWSVTAMRPASSDRADRQNYRKTTPEATPSAAA